MKKISYHGLPINIEYRKGETKPDKDSIVGGGYYMYADYGHIVDTYAMDEEELDVFVGPEDCDLAFMAYMMTPEGETDEVKVVLGFQDEAQVRDFCSWQYGARRVPGVVVAITIPDLIQAIAEQKQMALKMQREESEEEPELVMGN